MADTDSWEQRLAWALESMNEVSSYFKNDPRIGFAIPYTFEGDSRCYFPDFAARVGDLNLIVEVTGEKKPDKEAKASTARNLWIPAINNDGRFGKWGFVEIRDSYNAKTEIREIIEGQ